MLCSKWFPHVCVFLYNLETYSSQRVLALEKSRTGDLIKIRDFAYAISPAFSGYLLTLHF